jgi:glycosyltransferase involved in cell wall biosynthesis
MRNDPTISVVMSVYNGEKHVRDAIDSILKQVFEDFEFIIVNDGSTDRTKEILESFKDQRIVLIHQENMGLSKSLNKGISLAKGKYIARQDADDISIVNRLEKQFKYLEKHQNVALLGTWAYITDQSGKLLQKITYPCDYPAIKKGLKRHNYFCHGSVVFKRNAFLELGGYREFFSSSQDYDLWLRFAENFEVANLSNLLYKRRIDQNAFTIKNIALQTRMRMFARQLASTREKGQDETIIIEGLKNYLQSPLSLTEKREMISSYNYWCRLLLMQNKNNDAFSLMEEGVKYQPFKLFILLFRIVNTLRSPFLLKILIKSWNIFRRFEENNSKF